MNLISSPVEGVHFGCDRKYFIEDSKGANLGLESIRRCWGDRPVARTNTAFAGMDGRQGIKIITNTGAEACATSERGGLRTLSPYLRILNSKFQVPNPKQIQKRYTLILYI